METDDTASRRKKPHILLRIPQWIVTIVLGLIFLVLTVNVGQLQYPGASPILYWAAVAALAIATICLSPPLFFRMSGKIRSRIYIGSAGAFILFGIAIVNLQHAYERTPDGAAAAARREEREQIEAVAAAKREEQEQRMADAEASLAKLEEINEKLEDCFSWGHVLPDLRDEVRDSLHNPGAFEHVETVLIVPDEDRRNVVMQFRAENAYGAIRTGIVKAQLHYDDCSISNISAPETL